MKRFAFPLLALVATSGFAQTSQTQQTAPPKRPQINSVQDKINQSSASRSAAHRQEAAQKQQPAPSSSAMPQAPMAPEMEKISKLLLGRWRTREQHEPTPWNASGGQGSGMETVTFGPGHHSLMFDYRSSGPNGRFEGRGIWLWDPAAKSFKTTWVDNMGPMMAHRTGTWQGDKLVFTGTDDVMGTRMDFRETYSDFNDSGFTFTMEMSPAGKNQWKKAMTVTSTKLGAMTAPPRVNRRPEDAQQPVEKK